MKKKYFKIISGALFLVGISLCSFAADKPKVITPSAPVVSESLKPIIADYQRGDYIQSMVKLEDLVEKEPKNTYANYYLALTYTHLGMKEKAQKQYDIVIALNTNMSLRYYSQKALACLENPNEQSCGSIKSISRLDRKKDVPEENKDGNKINQEDEEMARFIESGIKIHPAAVDSITKERMERKLQAEEYLRKHQEQEDSENQSA